MKNMTPLADFRDAEAIDEPFPHLLVPQCLDAGLGSELLEWFEQAPWESRRIEGSYETPDIPVERVELPPRLEVLRTPAFTDRLRREMTRWTGLPFESRLDIRAQKRGPGHRIGARRDFGPVRQTHRLLFQLNSGWSFANGGLLMLFDAPEAPEDSAARVYLPRHLSAVAIEVSPRSYHAVSEIHRSVRYTLAYSFYCVDGHRAVAPPLRPVALTRRTRAR